jgi:hypothetical protein
MGQAMGGPGGANRLEIRVRGNAHQLLEKYKVLARDAQQAGDRVATEYYLQHADHYFRVLNDSRIRQEEMRARRNAFDGLDDEGDEDMVVSEGVEEAADRRDGRIDAPRDGRGDAPRDRRDGPRDGEWSGRESSQEGDRRSRDPDSRGRDGEFRRRAPERDYRREDAEGRMNGDAVEHRLSDGEAALMAFGGPAVRESGDEAGGAGPGEAGAAGTDDAPRPRRRGRPRKAEIAPAEG